MRLVAFCDYYHPDSCGGAERVAREVYARLATTHGLDITVIGTGPSDGRHAVRESIGEAEIREILVRGHDLSGLLGAQLTVSPRLSRVARQLIAQKPDVLHANSLHFHGTYVASRLARRLGIPLVTTAHLGSVDALPTRLRLAARGWDHSIGRSIVKSSNRLVAVSDSVARHLEYLGADPSRITVAYNGVDHSTFHPRGRRERAGRLRIGFVGRLIANKGPQLLFDAVAAARATGADLELVVIGDGPMRAQLEERAHSSALVDRVRFTGHVTDVATQLRELDVVVRPSYTEGLPLAVIEAMACGTVVLCSDVRGNLELVQDGSTGLVFPAGDHQTLARLIVRTSREPELLEGLREKAVARARDLSWDASAKFHLEAIQAASRWAQSL